jgi:hypothetical protein
MSRSAIGRLALRELMEQAWQQVQGQAREMLKGAVEGLLLAAANFQPLGRATKGASDFRPVDAVPVSVPADAARLRLFREEPRERVRRLFHGVAVLPVLRQVFAVLLILRLGPRGQARFYRAHVLQYRPHPLLPAEGYAPGAEVRMSASS